MKSLLNPFYEPPNTYNFKNTQKFYGVKRLYIFLLK
ncbi:hypothetical protein AGR1C_Cc10671 [Agrobacterium fabacearum TT111]|nr:hypothetical protein AGR1C_Cc10671 [Agrobacterium fabacearum TT111]